LTAQAEKAGEIVDEPAHPLSPYCGAIRDHTSRYLHSMY
jgi:hypothetical protein